MCIIGALPRAKLGGAALSEQAHTLTGPTYMLSAESAGLAAAAAPRFSSGPDRAAAETEAAKEAKERETKRLDERVLTLNWLCILCVGVAEHAEPLLDCVCRV